MQRRTLALFLGTHDDIRKDARTDATVLALWQHLDFSDFKDIFGVKELNNPYRLTVNRHDRDASSLPKLRKVPLVSGLIPATPGGVEKITVSFPPQ